MASINSIISSIQYAYNVYYVKCLIGLGGGSYHSSQMKQISVQIESNSLTSALFPDIDEMFEGCFIFGGLLHYCVRDSAFRKLIKATHW